LNKKINVVNIIHPTLNKPGGAEKMCLYLIKILKSSGYTVNLYTIDKVNWIKLKRIFGEVSKPDNEIYVFKKLPNLNNIFLYTLLFIHYLKLLILSKKKKNAININNYGEILPLISDFSYVHSLPLFLICKNYKLNPFNIPIWNFFSKIYYLSYLMLKKIFKQSFIICNSKFIANIFEDYQKLIVINPPIINENLQDESIKKERIIITISRFKKMKNLLMIPKLLSKIKSRDFRFYLVGIMDHGSKEIIDEILYTSRKLNVHNYLTIISNPTPNLINELLSRSTIYLSTQKYEAFGMTIIEAMNRGCIPIVHKDSGAWTDILNKKQGLYGFSYKTINEAAKWIDLILQNDALRWRLSYNARIRARKFDDLYFKRKFLRLIQKIKGNL